MGEEVERDLRSIMIIENLVVVVVHHQEDPDMIMMNIGRGVEEIPEMMVEEDIKEVEVVEEVVERRRNIQNITKLTKPLIIHTHTLTLPQLDREEVEKPLLLMVVTPLQDQFLQYHLLLLVKEERGVIHTPCTTYHHQLEKGVNHQIRITLTPTTPMP